MRQTLLLLAALALTPVAAFAQMSAAEFDAYTKGKTLYYSQGGAPYGAEVYRENQRVEWSFLDGECRSGRWYEDAGLICFVYEDKPEPQCWSFERGGTGLIARFEGRAGTTEIYQAEDRAEQMLCLGPKVGV